VAITHVGTETASNSANNVAGNLSPNVPAGTIEGDVMLAFVYKAADSVHTVSAPGGWTALSSGAQQTTNLYGRVWYRVAGDSEPGSYTWSVSSTGIWGVAISTFRGVSSGSPINANAGDTYTTQDPATAPTVTTTLPTNIVTFRASRDNSTAEVTHTASGVTELADWGNDGGASTRNGAIYFDSAAVTAGSGRGGLSVNPSGSVTDGVMFTIALTVFSELDANAAEMTHPTTTANKPVPAVGAMAPVIGT
jgi:hypothetical protein